MAACWRALPLLAVEPLEDRVADLPFRVDDRACSRRSCRTASPLRLTVHDCVTSATRSNTTRPSGAARRVTRIDCTDGRRRLDDALRQRRRRARRGGSTPHGAGRSRTCRARAPGAPVPRRSAGWPGSPSNFSSRNASSGMRSGVVRRLPAHGILGHEAHVIAERSARRRNDRISASRNPHLSLRSRSPSAVMIARRYSPSSMSAGGQ